LHIDEEAVARLEPACACARPSEEVLVQADSDFHAMVASCSGNTTPASMLSGLSTGMTRSRIWRGVIEDNAGPRRSTSTRDPTPFAPAIRSRGKPRRIHVGTTEAWFRRLIDSAPVS
jgi:GntR family transcriptional repressor for pyruvate dehydrogenase complex